MTKTKLLMGLSAAALLAATGVSLAGANTIDPVYSGTVPLTISNTGPQASKPYTLKVTQGSLASSQTITIQPGKYVVEGMGFDSNNVLVFTSYKNNVAECQMTFFKIYTGTKQQGLYAVKAIPQSLNGDDCNLTQFANGFTYQAY